jgi:hypothetical protein
MNFHTCLTLIVITLIAAVTVLCRDFIATASQEEIARMRLHQSELITRQLFVIPSPSEESPARTQHLTI